MNRIEKLKNEMAHSRAIQIDKKYKPEEFTIYANARRSFIKGFDAASAEYEKIIAELEGAIEHYLEVQKFLTAPQEDTCVSSNDFRIVLQKLKEFRG